MSNNYPIILAHGIARFDHLSASFRRRLNLFLWDLNGAFDRWDYFRGIISYLRGDDIEAYATFVSFAADVDERARMLKGEIEAILARTGHKKVHIIGHSMGGLDSRHMIVDHGMADRVASLTTIGTPHLGTTFAEWGLTHGGEAIIRSAGGVLNLGGFLNLTADVRGKFNERARQVEATNDVVYQTIASSQERPLVFRPLQASWQIIHDAEGDNDGLVPVTSQHWTDRLESDDGRIKPVRQFDFPVPADHLNQIGWWDLEELTRARWWRLDVVREKRRYEAAVRDVYRRIAHDVRTL